MIVINLVLDFSRILPLDGGNSGPDEICHFHLHIIYKLKNYSSVYLLLFFYRKHLSVLFLHNQEICLI